MKKYYVKDYEDGCVLAVATKISGNYYRVNSKAAHLPYYNNAGGVVHVPALVPCNFVARIDNIISPANTEIL